MTLRTGAHQLAGRRDFQRGDDAYHSRHLVSGKAATAGLDDFSCQLGPLRALTPSVRLIRQHHFRGDHGASDWITARLHERHPYLRNGIDDSLNLFRMNFQTADIDDATGTPHKMVTALAQIDPVTCVYEAIRASYWRELLT